MYCKDTNCVFSRECRIKDMAECCILYKALLINNSENYISKQKEPEGSLEIYDSQEKVVLWK